MSKAFDRVPHDILLKKLAAYGFIGPIIKWFSSYLEHRTFYVVLNGYKSNIQVCSSGVPQGSHLGPSLFNIFINDIIVCFQNSSPYIFADDLKFIRAVGTLDDSILLQKDIDRLVEWCNENGMSLNAAKCRHIKFTRNVQFVPSFYSIKETILEEVTTLKDLGIVLDSKLTFLPHSEQTIKKASKKYGL